MVIGAGPTLWVSENETVRRWDGAQLITEDAGSSAGLVDGIQRDDGSTVFVGHKGAVLVRSAAGQWRTLPVRTKLNFTSVTRADNGRLILGTSRYCDQADDVCAAKPPTTDDPTATPPRLAGTCRLPGTTSPGCGCGAGASFSGAWMIIALTPLRRRRLTRRESAEPGGVEGRGG